MKQRKQMNMNGSVYTSNSCNSVVTAATLLTPVLFATNEAATNFKL